MKIYIQDVDDDFEDSDSYSKWDYLLQRTLILFTEPRILKKLAPISKKWLNKYEQANNYRFPDGYKDFLSTYGSGTFGNNDISIGTPGKIIEEARTFVIHELENYPDATNNDSDFRVIENGYFFGRSNLGAFFLFDLSSFREEDACCDIYVLSLFEPQFISCLGRDFFYFVRELCLNNKIDEWLPNTISLSSEVDEDDEYEQEVSSFNGIFIPEWIIPRSW